MTELIIEGYNVDLDVNTTIELSYSINDIRNPISTNNTWSKTIELPGTKNNNDIFNFIYDNNIEVGFNPNLKKECEIRINSIPIIVGYMRLDEVSITNGDIVYSIIIYGSNTSIFNDMGESLLIDLDLTEYDHTFTKDAVTNSWEQINREGYYYPFANYSDIKWSYDAVMESGISYALVTSGESYPMLYPGFYVKTIIDKVFTRYGYRYDSNFFNSDTFKRLYIPFSNATIGSSGLTIQYDRSEYIYNNVYHRTGSTTYDPAELYLTPPEHPTWEPSIFTPSDGYWSFRIVGSTMAGSGFDFVYGKWSVKSRRYPQNDFETVYYENEIFNSVSHDYQRTFDWSFSIPDKILKDRRIIVSTIFDNYHAANKAGANYTVYWSFNTKVPLINATYISPSDTLPIGLKQKELFQTLISMFNLYIQATPGDEKLLIIEPYEDFYSRSSNEIDWTYKVDERQRKYTLMSELDAASYFFTYKIDNDDINKTYKDDLNEIPGQIEKFVQSDFVKAQKKIELLPSAQGIEQVIGSDYLIWPSTYSPIPSSEEENSGYTGTINTKWNWRILSQNVIYDLPYGITYNSIIWGDFYTGSHIDGYHGPDYDYGVSLWFDRGDINYLWDLNNLSGNTLYNTYWEKYINMISNQNSKLLTIDVYLNENDLSKLNFYEKIFIDDCWYYLNKLVYSPNSKKAKAELLLVPAGDDLGLIYSGFTLSDTILYETQVIQASVDIINNFQGQEPYSFLFRLLSGTTTIEEWSMSGVIDKRITKTISQSISLSQSGDFIVQCTNNFDYIEEIPISVITMYVITNIQYTPNPLTFASNLTATYDIVVSGDWVGSTWVSVRLGDDSKVSNFTFSAPGTQSGSGTWNNMGMGQKHLYISDQKNYISQHYYIDVIPRTPTQGAWTSVLDTTLTLNFDSRNECNLGNEWQVASDSGFTTIVQSGTRTPETNLTVAVSSLTASTAYWSRIRGKSTGPLYSSWSNIVSGSTIAAGDIIYLTFDDTQTDTKSYTCQSQSYQFTYNTSTCYLKDSGGTAVVNPYAFDIEVVLNQNGTQCGGGSYGQIQINIPSGQSQASGSEYCSGGTEDCGRGCEQFGGYTDNIDSITNASSCPRIVIGA